ncbi:MAG: bifunctional oligoribonuclease/PAP phosphatase NrnA [Candidatus Dojkabacteria bacterium]
MKNSTPQNIWNQINKAEKIILTMDGRYDPDAVVSSTVLHNVILRELKKEIYMTYCGTLNHDVDKFSDKKLYHENTDPSEIDFSKFDLHIMIDSGTKDKISTKSGYQPQSIIPIINIDHHDDNDGYGSYNYVKHGYPSASYVLYELLTSINIELTQSEKELILLASITDTNFFQNTLASGNSFIQIGEMIQKEQLDYHKVLQSLVMNKPEANFILRKLVYKNLTIDHENSYAYSWATLAEVKEIGLDWKKVTERHVDLFKSMESVKFVFFVTELADSNYELSMRSRDLEFSVLDILKVWNGGGYKVAGGAKLGKFDSMGKAIEEVKRGINLVVNNS